MVRLSSAKRGRSGFSVSPEREENTELICGNRQQRTEPIVQQNWANSWCMTVLLSEAFTTYVALLTLFPGRFRARRVWKRQIGSMPGSCLGLHASAAQPEEEDFVGRA